MIYIFNNVTIIVSLVVVVVVLIGLLLLLKAKKNAEKKCTGACFLCPREKNCIHKENEMRYKGSSNEYSDIYTDKSVDDDDDDGYDDNEYEVVQNDEDDIEDMHENE